MQCARITLASTKPVIGMMQRHEDRRALLQQCATRTALRRMFQRAAAAAAVSCAGAMGTQPSEYAAGGCGELTFMEIRGVLRDLLDSMVHALAPACWAPSLVRLQASRGACTKPGLERADARLGCVLVPSAEGHVLAPGHVLTAADVLAALDYPRCIHAQGALARPGGAQRAVLQQCTSLTQLVRCVLGQTGGVVDQLGRGIALEELAGSPASVDELCRVFEDVPALVRLLPRRAQAAPGRLLMAQQRLLLAHLGAPESLAACMDCLDYEAMLQTLRYLEEKGDVPLDLLWEAPPSLAAPAVMASESTRAAGSPVAAGDAGVHGPVVAALIAEGNPPNAGPETEARAGGEARGGAASQELGPEAPEPEPEAEQRRPEPAAEEPEPESETSEPEPKPESEPEEPEAEERGPEELTPLRAQIRAVLKQVHPDMGITSTGQLVMQELIFGHAESRLVSSARQRARQRLAEARLAQELVAAQETKVFHNVYRRTAQPPGVSLAEVAAAMSPADLVVAVRMHFQGELAKHGIKEGLKAVKNFDSNRGEDAFKSEDTATGKRVQFRTHSERAGLVFCVQRSVRQLWQQTGAHGEGPRDSMLRAAVFLTAVKEYMCAELLELAGNAARDNRKANVIPRHICLAIKNDQELSKQFSDVAIFGGGRLPVSAARLPPPFLPLVSLVLA
jgi:histone H2A